MIQWYMLDTNMVTYIVGERSPAAVARLLALTPPAVACISAITEAELLYVIAKKKGALPLRMAITLFLERIEVLPWGSQEAEKYGDLRATHESMAKTSAPYALFIAAHAISLNATLVTADRAFFQVEGLRSIENWATDLA